MITKAPRMEASVYCHTLFAESGLSLRSDFRAVPWSASHGLQFVAPSFRAACRAKQAAEKPMGTVILRSQQATKNLHLLENTKCRSFAPKSGPPDDTFAAFFRRL